VLDLAGQRHARVFRTDEQGTIHCLGTACQAGRR
jgi:beta-lactamase superfamily II metal-dependent hydrolase